MIRQQDSRRCEIGTTLPPTAVLLQTTTSQSKGQGWLRIHKSRRASCGGRLSLYPAEICTPSKSSKCMQKKCYAGRIDTMH
mmetsp:Transcript_14257/g.30630  ORF Transcript_14257/g.30630 Transcript_14257/m.30630 type:complete len:81 (+) Transcript_14257:280-522(+)